LGCSNRNGKRKKKYYLLTNIYVYIMHRNRNRHRYEKDDKATTLVIPPLPLFEFWNKCPPEEDEEEEKEESLIGYIPREERQNRDTT